LLGTNAPPGFLDRGDVAPSSKSRKEPAMPDLVRRYENKNQPIVFPKKGLLASTYFNLVHL